MRILLVEDEHDLRTLLQKRLQKFYTVDACSDGEAALDYLCVYSYDLLLLDIMLPKLDGLSLLRKIRANGNETHAILLTAKGMIEDRVKGLDAGADDYLVKPFAFEELLARIRVLQRRSASNSTNVLRVGDLTLDLETQTVRYQNDIISLRQKEYLLLEYMMHHPNIILTRHQLEQRICDPSYEGGSNLIDVYIRYLRRKIDDTHNVKMIHTIRGVGYRLSSGE